MFDDYVVYVIQYFEQLTSLFSQEVDTVYEIFEKDVVCQVMSSLIDRVFNDQTLGVLVAFQLVSRSNTSSPSSTTLPPYPKKRNSR